MNTYLSAARAILKDHPDGLHYEELTRRALMEGLITTSGKTPGASMNAQLSTTIKRHGSAAPFVRLKPGVFALNLVVDENPPAATPTKTDTKKTPRSPKDDEAIESAFTEKAESTQWRPNSCSAGSTRRSCRSIQAWTSSPRRTASCSTFR